MSAFGRRIIGAVGLTLVCFPALAGPCADEIYQTDLAINKKLDAAASKGKAAPQSTFATTHRQPTPASVAAAEQQVGDISEAVVTEVRAFMQAAREADAAGDKEGCEQALAEAKKIVGP